MPSGTRSRSAAGRSDVGVGNDTLAVLRAGTERGWGVAIVCGAGINCVGVAPDGRQVRFPALGRITGDWGGGYDVGLEALWVAARSEDGRGPRTSLEQRGPAPLRRSTRPLALAEEIHAGRIAQRRMIELAPVVFAEAADDAVAAGIVHQLAAEIVALARAATHTARARGRGGRGPPRRRPRPGRRPAPARRDRRRPRRGRRRDHGAPDRRAARRRRGARSGSTASERATPRRSASGAS